MNKIKTLFGVISFAFCASSFAQNCTLNSQQELVCNAPVSVTNNIDTSPSNNSSSNINSLGAGGSNADSSTSQATQNSVQSPQSASEGSSGIQFNNENFTLPTPYMCYFPQIADPDSFCRNGVSRRSSLYWIYLTLCFPPCTTR